VERRTAARPQREHPLVDVAEMTEDIGRRPLVAAGRHVQRLRIEASDFAGEPPAVPSVCVDDFRRIELDVDRLALRDVHYATTTVASPSILRSPFSLVTLSSHS